jgi:CTP synthase
VTIRYIDSEEIEKVGAEAACSGLDGILCAPGFGARGTEGKIAAIRYAREKRVPFFGICFGMQLAVVEFARHVCGMTAANSTEIDPETRYPVISMMNEQRQVTAKGGTMRLGAYPCVLSEGTRAFEAYGAPAGGEISERHRHRYEFNNEFREALTGRGLVLSGLSPDGKLVEMIELGDHPYFVACQFHPEFKSRPLAPHPLFRRFIRAAHEHSSRLRAADAPRPAGAAPVSASSVVRN